MSANLIKATSVVGSVTLLSRISGLARDVVFAHLLGDKTAADVFIVAFRVPNLFRRLSAEGAFSAAFVPVFTEFRQHNSHQEQRAFVSLMFGRFGLVLSLLSLLGVLFAPAVISLLAPGFHADADQYQLAVDATRITFPYLLFISLVAMSAGMLNTCGRFAAPAATPLLLNICLIGAALGLAPYFSAAPIALAVGVVIAGVAQLLFQLPFLRREKLLVRPRIRSDADSKTADAGTRKVLRLMLPVLFGSSVDQLNILIGTLLASLMATGSISWLYYAGRLVEFPLGVFGIALATVILPSLSKEYATVSSAAFYGTLEWALRWVLLICVPATVGLVLLAQPMVVTIYFYGDFSINGIYKVAGSVIAFGLGLTAIVLTKVFVAAFYARQDTRTPVRIGVIAIAVNLAVCLLLFTPLQHIGLALAASIAAVVNAALLYRALHRQGFRIAAVWVRFAAQVAGATLLMAAVLLWLRGDTADWMAAPALTRIAQLGGLVVSAGAVYGLSLLLLGLKIGWLSGRRADS